MPASSQVTPPATTPVPTAPGNWPSSAPEHAADDQRQDEDDRQHVLELIAAGARACGAGQRLAVHQGDQAVHAGGDAAGVVVLRGSAAGCTRRSPGSPWRPESRPPGRSPPRCGPPGRPSPPAAARRHPRPCGRASSCSATRMENCSMASGCTVGTSSTAIWLPLRASRSASRLSSAACSAARQRAGQVDDPAPSAAARPRAAGPAGRRPRAAATAATSRGSSGDAVRHVSLACRNSLPAAC